MVPCVFLAMTPVAILSGVAFACGLHEFGVICHVGGCPASIEFSSVETKLVEALDVALIIEEAFFPFTTGTAVEIPAHFDLFRMTVVDKLSQVGELIRVDHGEAIDVMLTHTMVWIRTTAVLPPLVDADAVIAYIEEGHFGSLALDTPDFICDRINRLDEGVVVDIGTL